jgi:energy-coupling factor transporter ATP-binding protein EcfA2
MILIGVEFGKGRPVSTPETVSTTTIPATLREAWQAGEWRPIRQKAGEARDASLPALRAMLDRFLRGETTLPEFAQESQDFSMSEGHWGYRGFAQMHLNQYAKVAAGADVIEETEAVLRSALVAPTSENEAREKLSDVVALTERLVDEAARLGVGKPAPGRVPLVVSYFWEAQNRDQWPMAYPATKATLQANGLYRETSDPAESYLALRKVVLDLTEQLNGDVWDIEALLWLLRPQKKKKTTPEPTPPPLRPPGPNGGDEMVADIYAAYREQDLIFRDEIITTFVLSLWTKPFVILTGISGTGKTRIAQALAQALEPSQTDASPPPPLEPGDEEHASFRVTDWTLKSGRLYVGLDQLPAFDVPERGGSIRIEVDLPGGATGKLRLNNIDLSATTRELRLLFGDASMRHWLTEYAKPGDVLRLDFETADRARATLVQADSAVIPTRHLLLPVGADWSDSRELLGFWNPISTSYERSQAIDLILRAAEDRERPYFLILDEMNLARVEYYFADFLSAMESGEAIPLYPDSAFDDIVPRSLSVPPNLFVIGTVNVDETTHAFSPKVLDRASVIEFNDVFVHQALSGILEELPSDSFRLENPSVSPSAFRVVSADERQSIKTALVDEGPTYAGRMIDLEGLLEWHRLHFGYRVIDEITTYVGLAREHVGASAEILAAAFDLAVYQKVLPKLNGGRELDEPLRRLLAFLLDPDDFAGDRWKDAEDRWRIAVDAIGEDDDLAVAYLRSAGKVARMLQRLQDTGFVSFLE